MKNSDPYADLKSIPGETRYVDFDEEFDCWAVFGSRSGFCYGQYETKEQAEEDLPTEAMCDCCETVSAKPGRDGLCEDCYLNGQDS